ncbi:MAG: hypothetical protein HUJ60_02335, partial [Bacilli bacterium]|nr:hypothetical protein [Bacilli bacterium]
PVVAPKPEPIPEPEPEPEPEPAPIPEPVVVAPAIPEEPEEETTLNDVKKIIRIPFSTRMKEMDATMKSNYNELKSEIMSYGVKSRISNKGDTFRLHKKTFVRITIAGKSLKLYLALDPKDYANSTFPISDAGDKAVYAEIPLVFKVKSELSMRRAKQLIADVMEKNGLEQSKVEPHNWAEELPQGEEDDNASDED